MSQNAFHRLLNKTVAAAAGDKALQDKLTRGRKIIAAFVVTKKRDMTDQEVTEAMLEGDFDPDFNEASVIDAEVVSIGSGNRCISGEEVSLHGDIVQDCHAEIVARRGFVRYLYRQLTDAEEDDSIFDADPSAPLYDAEGTLIRRLQLKADVGIHLYINLAPCGDSAVFQDEVADIFQECILKDPTDYSPKFLF